LPRQPLRRTVCAAR